MLKWSINNQLCGTGPWGNSECEWSFIAASIMHFCKTLITFKKNKERERERERERETEEAE